MKKSLFLLLVLLLTGCSSTWHVSTTGHDPIYSIEGSDAEILVINNEFELQRLLRTDFNFRFDFAQYALSQPVSFDWNNRILGNRYNRYNPYWGYGYYWNRDQMWNDWVWGFTPHRWSPFGYDRWGYNNYYGWNNYYSWNHYGWNNWGVWNNQINPNWGRSYVNGRRSSTRINTNRRVVNSNRVVTTPRTRTVIKNKPRVNPPRTRVNPPRTRVNPPRTRVNPPSRQPSTIRTTPRTSTRSTNSNVVRSNSRRKN